MIRQKSTFLYWSKTYNVILWFSILIQLAGCATEYQKEVSCNYLMENTKSNQALYGDVSILSSVVEYDYGSNFIVAIQKPNFEKQRGYLADVIRMRKYNMKGGSYISMSLKEADSILRNDPFYRSVFLNKINYWIVYCKDSTSVFGLYQSNNLLK